ncbi:MAG: UDP-N-acetylglucosamine--N-acetylmuramyl-(pentapeptide) pyrophosphoryl-undecaprenol N-acetylglucosamine transferase [Planctomycetes bacterium]|nr:UDP-N-acetylglucosamine--N-acetylmuramyl-(pentapeptide) pyrophosphoryl-undecaprenol N-acetylglucosamine transferase [Planctomycetota bacterium]
MPNVLIAGGGSGGHVAPAIAIAQALKVRECDAIIAHSTRAIDRKMVDETAFQATALSAKPLSLSPLGFAQFCCGFLRAARQTKSLIREHKLKCVVATGGFVAAPALWAASRLNVPTILMNFDTPAGKANKLASRWTDTVLSTVAWDEVDATIVPPPLRACSISTHDQRTNNIALGLDPKKMTLLVTGASQGAGTINDLIPALASAAPNVFLNWQILHLAGEGKAHSVEKAYQQSAVAHLVLPFTNEMGRCWGAADLAVTRGGANTIAEIAFNAVPSVVLPYPYHDDDHQRSNAEPLAALGGVVIETDYKALDTNIRGAGRTILSLLRDHHQRFEMQQALTFEAPINGASVIADAVLSAIEDPLT